MIDSFSIGFLRTLWILRDYLHEIIVGGGWAPFLYYRYLLQNRDYEVTIDEPLVIQDPHNLKVKVPTPAAYIFQKGLIFTRRNSAVKKAKDLYYIFDILTGCSDLKPKIMNDFKEFAKTYSPWFKTFLKNLTDFFETTDSEGILLISEQRPATALTDLDDDQFKQYIYGTFDEVIQELMTFKSP